MSATTYPSVSVIICTFNGARGIGDCLKGLTAQTYPKDKLTIIVVDDGCTDNSAAIAKQYGARIIAHGQNRGVQHARNTGYRAAKGDIIAYLDDDCVVASDWLMELVKPFTDNKVVGVGGRVVAHKTDRVAERFMEATGYGNPEPLLPVSGELNNPVRRIRSYLQNMYRPLTISKTPVEAQAIYTANVAYRGSALRAIGGFDSTLHSNEDSDVATRLRATGGKLIFAPKAIARHRHHERLWHVIRQTYYRAGHTYQYYRKNHMLPPIFPFPLLYGMGMGLTFVSPFAGLLWIVAGPALLYNSWLLHGWHAKNAEYALYAYIQLAREAGALLGFLRGALAVQEQKGVIGAYATRNAAAAPSDRAA